VKVRLAKPFCGLRLPAGILDNRADHDNPVAPAFLEAFVFESVPASASLMRAIEVLREANRSEKSSLPKLVPTGFVKPRWAAQVMPGGTIDRRYYELCVLSELRDRLRAGDVWVTGSRQYRSYEERLITPETLENVKQSGDLPIAVEADFDTFIAGRRTLLDERRDRPEPGGGQAALRNGRRAQRSATAWSRSSVPFTTEVRTFSIK
jgi:hypothetical protein